MTNNVLSPGFLQICFEEDSLKDWLLSLALEDNFNYINQCISSWRNGWGDYSKDWRDGWGNYEKS